MPVFKNVSGVRVEVKHHTSGGKIVDVDGELDAQAQLVSEEDDAYVTKSKIKVTKRNSDGQPEVVEVDQLRAWPKAVWEKVSKVPENKASRDAAVKNDEKEVK